MGHAPHSPRSRLRRARSSNHLDLRRRAGTEVVTGGLDSALVIASRGVTLIPRWMP